MTKNEYGSLDDVLLFHSLLPLERQKLQALCEYITCADGQTIASEGELSHTFFVVLQGRVKVHVDKNGQDVFICYLEKGSTFGESSLFLDMKRTANVSAVVPTTLLKLTRQELFSFISAEPEAGNRILLVLIHGLMKKLREANQELAYERGSASETDEVDSLMAELERRGNR